MIVLFKSTISESKYLKKRNVMRF